MLSEALSIEIAIPDLMLLHAAFKGHLTSSINSGNFTFKVNIYPSPVDDWNLVAFGLN